MKDGAASLTREAILERLRQVIDPETGADVVRMKLVDNMEIGEGGHVSYTFRPSSPLCPLAVFLATQIKQAVAEVPGVTGQAIQVENYLAAEKLTLLINAEE
ncbi:MAG: iron-sulfur cluster assembly protein [Anaerolineales bacterium]|jgi:metal-sulfur cluster biosynthetic enzyme